jgi:antitoxin (DNA-binding transcriptional repressor) of toxin-antitoxin stability system
MKTIGLEETSFDQCIDFAQQERVLVTRDGKPVAVIVGVGGLDQEQLELAGSAKFWELIDQRRKQKTLSRADLERSIGGSS